MKKIKERFLSICGVALVILGILAIVFGYWVSYPSNYERSNTYGGDAYTGIQNAAAQTANNVSNLGETYEESYIMFMTFIGITMITAGILCILYNKADIKLRRGEESKRVLEEIEEEQTNLNFM